MDLGAAQPPPGAVSTACAGLASRPACVLSFQQMSAIASMLLAGVRLSMRGNKYAYARPLLLAFNFRRYPLALAGRSKPSCPA